MERNSFFRSLLVFSFLVSFFSISPIVYGSELDQTLVPECDNCFTTEVVDVERDGNCVTVTMQVNADENCLHALSHFMVAIPCGTVTSASNSGNWPMELMVTDPTTGITGFKVDEISGFGENGEAGSFSLSYTVCGSDNACADSIANGVFHLSYKAATCVFYEDINPEETSVPLAGVIEAIPVSCYGSTDGRVITTVSGGSEPYSYQWNNGVSTSVLENVVAGTYSVVVTDAKGGQMELSAEVSSPTAIEITGIVIPAACAQNTGAIDISVTGGTGSYGYLWTNGVTTEDVSELVSGSYQVTVTDLNGCSDKRPFYVSSQSPIKASFETSTLECHERGTGTISLEVWGGTEPYSFLWSNGETTQNLEGLDAESYRVTITDAEGCRLERSISVSQKIFYVSGSVTAADCANEGGLVTLTPHNGTGPYVAEWSNGETGMIIDSLAAGSYMVLVTDSNGCKINQQVAVATSGAVSVNTSVSSTGCDTENDPMIIEISASGGTSPYTYYINGELADSTFETNEEGIYSIEVVDAKGCTASDVVSVTRQSAQFSVEALVNQPGCETPGIGAASLTFNNGTEPFVVLWNEIEGGLSNDSLDVGAYVVRVLDANGCEASASFEIIPRIVPTVEVVRPSELPGCNSDGNIVEAVVANVETYYWTISSDDPNWSVTSESIQQAVYRSGTGSSTLVLVGESVDGCQALDFVELTCVEGSGGNDQDGDNDAENPTTPDTCNPGCIFLEQSAVTNLGNGCVRYALTFKTDGRCRYELSHLVIDLNGAMAMNVTNSRNWKMEINSTDPKSGLTGIKVDEISGFGKQNGDSFTVFFELCNSSVFDPSDITVALKAGTCLDIVNLIPANMLNDNQINLSVYPNPSAADTYFEFSSAVSTYAVLKLYNQSGVEVSELFKGTVAPGVVYRVKYNGGEGEDLIMFYQLTSGVKVIEGKLLRLK